MRSVRLLPVLILILVIPALALHASMLFRVSDLVSTSAPSAENVTHTISFQINHTVPAGGTIVITPRTGSFTIPADFNVGDIDVAVSNGGPWTDRTIATTSDTGVDGITITPGTAGSIVLTVAPDFSYDAGFNVRIILGQLATYDGQGFYGITNPTATGAHRISIESFSPVGQLIDSGSTIVFIVRQVSMQVKPESLEPVITNALPSGTIASHNPTIELSFNTNQISTCRYSLTPGVEYQDMTNSFSTVSGLFFYKVITGHQDNTTYHYYIRCANRQNTANANDYDLTFTLEPTALPPSDNALGAVYVPGPGGNGGVGEYRGGSDVLFQSSITLNGFAPKGSVVTVLKDGKRDGSVSTREDGTFTYKIESVERGIYSIGVYADDAKGRRSGTAPVTITVNAGTNNTINNVLVPPSASLGQEIIDTGKDGVVTGAVFPGGTVELQMLPRDTQATAGDVRKYTATTSAALSGEWKITIPAKDLARGGYEIRPRAVKSSEEVSAYGISLLLGVGQPPPKGRKRTDLNGDGKVNLIDFSIFLTYWTKPGIADFNDDDKTNLADFSIMLFDWSG